MAGWQSGYAAACKAVYAGSIPASASNLMLEYLNYVSIIEFNLMEYFFSVCPSGGIGRHKGLKIPR